MRSRTAWPALRLIVAGVTAVVVIACGGSAPAQPSSNAIAPSLQPPAAPTAAPVSPASSSAPSATPLAEGYVTGTWEFYGASSRTPAAGHDFVNALAFMTNEPQVNGDATFDAGSRFGATTGYTWGTMTITNGDGTWAGPCEGAAWGQEGQVVVSCDMRGTGGHAGKSFYVQMRGSPDFPLTVEGVVFDGTIPAE
jgi:hypothetical protein